MLDVFNLAIDASARVTFAEFALFLGLLGAAPAACIWQREQNTRTLGYVVAIGGVLGFCVGLALDMWGHLNPQSANPMFAEEPRRLTLDLVLEWKPIWRLQLSIAALGMLGSFMSLLCLGPFVFRSSSSASSHTQTQAAA